MSQEKQNQIPVGKAKAKHFDNKYIEKELRIEIDYLNEPYHAAKALHEYADELEEKVKNENIDCSGQIDNKIVDLRLMADKIKQADSNSK